MALNNILAPRQQVQNAQGVPIAGGFVFLYEPGTTTFITSYKDSGLVNAHTNPVRLSGSGRANIWISRDCDLLIEDRNNNEVLTEDNANPDALGGGDIGGLVPNGSFELDADADDIPDGWTLVSEASSTNEIDPTESTDGQNSFRFTSTGFGGGSLTVTDFFPVNDVDDLRVNFDLRSTLATVRNIVRVEWYDISTVFISNSDVYDSTANPTSYVTQNLLATPPANARFAKLRLIGIDPSVLLSGSTFFDRVEVFYPTVVSGIFDNITIQDNEIISTNVNGDIELTPNGTGRVVNAAGSFAANPRVRTDIVTATPPIAELVTGGYDIYDLDETDVLAQMGYFGSSSLALLSRMHGATVGLSGEDAGGVIRQLITADPDNSVILYEGGDPILQTTSLGIEIRPAASNIARLDFAESGGIQVAHIQHDGANLIIENLDNGGQVRLIADDAGGVSRDLLIGDPDGTLQLFYNDIIRAVCDINGVLSVRSDASTDVEARNLTLRHQDGTVRGLLGHTAGAILRIQNAIHGGIVRLEAEDTGGTLRSGLVVDPDVNTQIFHPVTGVIAAQSQDAAATDQATALAVRHADTAYYDVGLMELPAQVENAAYTFIKADIGKNIRHTDGVAYNYTIDQETTVAAGSAWLVTLRGAGVITLVTGSGVQLDYIDAGGAWVGTTGNVAMGVGEFLLKKVSDILYEAIGSGFP